MPQFDIAKYAKIKMTDNDITLAWEEEQDIIKIVITTLEPGTLSNLRIQYWQDRWLNPSAESIGKWQNADFKVLLEGTDVDAAKNVFPIAFKPINFKEFPDIKDFKAIYRRTSKLRFLFRGERQDIESIEVYAEID